MRLQILGIAAMMVGLGSMSSAQSFLVSQNGQSVGSATLSWARSGTGYGITSNASINMKGLNLSFSETGYLGPHLNLHSMQLNGQVNGTPVTVGAQSSNGQYQVQMFANGQRTQTPLPFHSRTVFFPDFDPAGLQAMLRLGAAYDNAHIWALIPKQSGSMAPMQITTDADMQGTLNGSAIPVHHYTVNVNGGTIEVFSNRSGDLLQAEWTQEGFAMVRQAFILTPPQRPLGTPPPPPPPQSTQQNGQQPNGQQPNTQQPQP